MPRTTPVELDHVFLMVPNQKTAERMLAKAGLRANYTRQHPGQGTTNLCAALDDMVIELLWLDGSAIAHESQMLHLKQRAAGEGSALGISWRGDADIETTAYQPPYFPQGNPIEVATACQDDPSLPLFFRSPATQSPKDGDKALFKSRQQPKFAELHTCRLSLRDPAPAASLLEKMPKILVEKGHSDSVEFLIQRPFKPGVVSIKWSL